MLTALDDSVDRIRGFDSGADIYLVKDSTLRDIEAAIRSLLRRTGRASGGANGVDRRRSEEHTSEIQSLMRRSYAVFSMKTKKKANMEKVMRHTLNARLNSTHNLSSRKLKKPLQFKLYTIYQLKTTP